MRIRLRVLVSIVLAALLPVVVGLLEPLASWQQVSVALATALTAILFLAQSIKGLLAQVRSAADVSIREQVERGTRDFRRAQRQLIDAGKETAVSTLGAGFAHTVNNPLTAIRGLTQVLLIKSQDEPGLVPYVPALREIEAATQRISDVVASTRRWAHGHDAEALTLVPLPEVLDEAWARANAGAPVTVEKRYDAAVPAIRGHRTQLVAAFAHLLDNAVCAAADQGCIVVSLTTLDAELVCVRIDDDGCGINPAIVHRVFEPFFTAWASTRRPHRGLGLAEARGIIEAHRGTVELESRSGGGATATVTLCAPATRVLV